MTQGRPTKLTPDRQSKLLNLIELGAPLTVACASAGVSYKVFREWMIKGESQTTGQYRDFRELVSAAEARAEFRLVIQWRQACQKDWRAAAEFLSRRFPERWSIAHRVKVEVASQVESELNMLFEAIAHSPDLTPEAKQTVFRIASQIEQRSSMAGCN